MNFKLLSKNNLGIVIVLILVILFSAPNMFNFLLNNTLGRVILILILLVLSYINKILGVVTLLLIIIIYNNSDIAYYEGFTPSNPTEAANQQEREARRQQIKTNVTSNLEANSADSTTTPPPTTTTTPQPTTATIPPPTTTTPVMSGSVQSAVQNAKANMSTSTEGFDVLGKERTLQKGKQSNSIPVNGSMNASTNVSPYEGSSFSESFASYY